ncbi:hypothetical protein HDU76_010573 [Blyttiomyces sp. JEL0837]|nr:hypothetical protein HDU76_010573 [Blyttiomyces sp. JEL0837]
MYHGDGPMRVTAISQDGTLVEHLANTSIISRVPNAAQLKLYYGVPIIDSADKATIGSSLDDFEKEIKDWDLGKFEDSKAMGEDKYYHVEKLNAHEYDNKSKTYSYHVKWLGYRDEANLLLPEPELSQAIVADYWEMVRLRSPLEYRKRVAFAKRYPKKISEKTPPPPKGKTTDADNEGFDSDSDEESNFEVVIPRGAPEDN